MSIDVRVPTTGNTGEDAVIVHWNVQVGSQVNIGDILVVLETAKATIEVESPASGTVLELRFGSGHEVPEHEILAVIGDSSEIGPSRVTVLSKTSVPLLKAAAPASTPSNSPASVETIEGALSPSMVVASPRARVIAQRHGMDLATVSGTGPGGRVIAMDVIAAGKKPAPPASVVVDSLPTIESPPVTGDFTLIPVRGARKITAQRMHTSLADSAQVTLTRYASATLMLSWVARVREAGASLVKIGVNDVVLFATSRAVAKHPNANSTFGWDGIRQYREVNLGFAVDTGQALFVPVIHRANTLSVAGIASAARGSIDRARSGKLTMSEMDGGTFTVSNLGSLGVHWFTPVLNPPQSCILGVGAIHQLHPEGPSLLPLSLTFDHRAIDGAAAAMLLADIVQAIETVDILSAL